MSAVDEGALPPSFKRGLAALRAMHRPEADVAALSDNFAYIHLGKEDGLEDRYTVSSADVFARVPITFPNAVPYGIVTHPILQRRDGGVIERFHPGHANCRPIADALGIHGLAFWSWSWDGMPMNKAEDMAHLAEWARKCLRLGV